MSPFFYRLMLAVEKTYRNISYMLIRVMLQENRWGLIGFARFFANKKINLRIRGVRQEITRSEESDISGAFHLLHKLVIHPPPPQISAHPFAA